jgi:hypothetical protein
MARKTPRFVVYHIRSTMTDATYVTYYHARNRCDKLNKRDNGSHEVSTIANYNKNVVHMVERVNMMSGKKYLEPSNTPNYCSPSSEAYWSM